MILSSSKEDARKRKEEARKRKAVDAMQKVEAAKEDVDQRTRKLEVDEAAAKRLYASAFGLSGDDAPPSKMKKPDNPFKAPASSYDSKLLAINNPFINVTEYPKHLMPNDIVVDGQFMDKEALRLAIKQLLDPVTVARAQYKSMGSELGARIFHAMVLLNLKFLTLPSTGVEIWVGRRVFLHDAEQESDEMRHEGDEGDIALDMDRADRYDLKGKVRDAESQEQVTVLIIESNWKGSPMKLYQASEYGIRAAVQNMIKKRFKPIYIHNWGDSVWHHGVLRPHHLARVKDGGVVELHTIDGVLQRDEIMRAEAGAGEPGGAGVELFSESRCKT